MEQAEALTKQVCLKCPFGEAMGVTGAGEGIVWTPTPGSGLPHTSDFWLKTKGEQFKKASKAPKPLDPGKLDQLEKDKAFAAEQCTDERLEQAWAFLLEKSIPRDASSFGEYVKWLFKDIDREEKREIQERGIGKAWKGETSRIANMWYCEKLKQENADLECD
jgi:hypothetical protein